MEKIIASVKELYSQVQSAIENDKSGKATTSELRSAAVKLGAVARHLERHLDLIGRAQPTAPAAEPAPASSPTEKAAAAQEPDAPVSAKAAKK